MAELNVLGSLPGGNQAPNGVIDSPSADVTIQAGASVAFAGTGSDPDNNLPLSYLWQFGAGSGVPNSTLQDPGVGAIQCSRDLHGQFYGYGCVGIIGSYSGGAGDYCSEQFIGDSANRLEFEVRRQSGVGG